MSVREVQHDKPAERDVQFSTSSRVRTCVGCGERVTLQRADAAAMTLVRLVLGPGGEVAVDAGAGGFGRGVHVHPRPDCVEQAALRGLARAAKSKVTLVWNDEPVATLTSESLSGTNSETRARIAVGEAKVHAVKDGLVPLDPVSLATAMVRAIDRRAHGLLLAAARAHKVALGADAVTGAVGRGDAQLVVVATDAAAAAELPAVRRFVTDGKAVAWGTKQVLAASCSPAASSKRIEGLGVVAIVDDRIAAVFRAAVHAAAALSSLSSGSTKRNSGGRSRRQKICGADMGDGVVEAASGSELSILERGA